MPTLTQDLIAARAGRSRHATATRTHATGRHLPLLDVARGLACLLIVAHHLAFYGPMSDVAHAVAPRLLDWLYSQGRLAVQVFLVIGGFLSARALAPQGHAVFGAVLPTLAKRYVRLAKPYLIALLVTLAVSAIVRPWLPGAPLVPGAPHLMQLLAHALLLQDLLGHEALSAGVWYVAIDFQLFALAVLVFAAARPAERRWPRKLPRPGVLLMLLAVLLSLFVVNRRPAWDVTALYFAGAYGLGMLAWWVSRAERPEWGALLMALIGALALALEYRSRIAVAWVTALLLVWATRQAWARDVSLWPRALLKLGDISFAVFLIHFPVVLAMSALVARFWPHSAGANAAGMAAVLLLSLPAGAWLHRRVEGRPRKTGPQRAPALTPTAFAVHQHLLLVRAGSA